MALISQAFHVDKYILYQCTHLLRRNHFQSMKRASYFRVVSAVSTGQTLLSEIRDASDDPNYWDEVMQVGLMFQDTD